MTDFENSKSGCMWRDTAYVYAVGALNDTELCSFEDHLLEGCGSCGAELRQARSAVAEADLAVVQEEDAKGPAGLRERLLARIDRDAADGLPEDAVASPSISGVSLVTSSEEGWRDAGFPGMRVRMLASDPVRRFTTSLIQMDPGTSYPSHRHAGREECYVITGDVRFGEHRLVAGDFQVAEAGSVHPEHSTEGGCLLLVVACQDDELVATHSG